MSERDELFDQRIHDAYEQIELSEDAQDRMLANLLAAQARREGMDAGGANEAQASKPEVVEAPGRAAAGSGPAHLRHVEQAPKRARWQMILPLAAVLVAAAVVVRLQPWNASARNDQVEAASETEFVVLTDEEAPKSAAPSEEEAASEDVAEPEELDYADDASGAAAAEEALEASGSDETDGGSAYVLSAVDEYPCITLKDGTVLSALEDATSTVEVPADRVGKRVEEAKAGTFEGGETVPCEVFALVDDAHAYAVRYDGEQSYWYCAPLE